MTRVCSWCKCFLGDTPGAGDGRPTHGICPRCLLSVLEDLEAMARRSGLASPARTWLIVVASGDVQLLQELRRRFSRSRLVDVIGDRRAASLVQSIAAPRDRRDRAHSQEHDRRCYGFFVVHRLTGRPGTDEVAP
jgi:hypothetical protein